MARDPIRRLPGGGPPEFARVPNLHGGEGAQAASQALNALARSAAGIGEEFRRRRQERQAEDDRETAAEVRLGSRIETDEEGRQRLVLPVEQAAAIEDDETRYRALTLGAVSAARNSFREQSAAVAEQHPLDPEAQADALRQWTQDIAGDLDPVIKAEVLADLDARAAAHVAQVRGEARQTEIMESREGLQADAQALVREQTALIARMGPEAVRTPEFERIATDMDTVLSELRNNRAIYGLTEADVDGFERDLTIARETAVARESVDRVIESEGFDAAYGAVETMADELGLGADERSSFVSGLRTHVNQRRIRANNRRVAAERAQREAERAVEEAREAQYQTMRVGVARGEIGTEEIDEALDRGEIDRRQWANLSIKRLSGDSTAVEDAEILRALDAGVPADPHNRDQREAVDAAFQAMASEVGGMAELVNAPGQFRESAMAVVGRYGIMPPSAASAVRGLASSGDPEQVGDAMEIISALQEQAPAAAQQAFGDLNDSAAVWAASVAAGQPRAEATALVARAQENANSPGNDVLRDRAREITRDFDINTVENALGGGGGFFGLFSGPDLPEDTQAAAEAVGAYRSLYTQAFMAYGNEAAAETAANTAFKRVYGTTRVRGDRELMAYPPENFYPDLGDRGAWMRDQLTRDVAEAIEAEEVGAERIRLVSDQTTAREAQNGRAPSYRVVYEDDDGVMHAVDGRFRFDPSDVLDESAQEAVEVSTVELSRARARRREIEEALGARNTELRERAVREWLMTDAGGGQQALARFDQWRDENPDAPVEEYSPLVAFIAGQAEE